MRVAGVGVGNHDVAVGLVMGVYERGVVEVHRGEAVAEEGARHRTAPSWCRVPTTSSPAITRAMEVVEAPSPECRA